MLPSSAASFLKMALPEAVVGLVEAEAGAIAEAAAYDGGSTGIIFPWLLSI
jgi:hypothetical protein